MSIDCTKQPTIGLWKENAHLSAAAVFQIYSRHYSPVSQITYTVLVETLNPAQSINQSTTL